MAPGPKTKRRERQPHPDEAKLDKLERDLEALEERVDELERDEPDT